MTSLANDNTAPELTQMGVYVHPNTYDAWFQAVKQKHGKYRNRASQEAEAALLDWAALILDERRVSLESSVEQLEGMLNSGSAVKKEIHVGGEENRTRTVADIPNEEAKQLNLTVRASTKSRWEAAMRDKYDKYRGVSSIEAEKALRDRANLILDGADVCPSDLRDVVDRVVAEFSDASGSGSDEVGVGDKSDSGGSSELVVGDDYDDDVPPGCDFGTLQPGHGMRIDPSRHRNWFDAEGMKKSQQYAKPILEGFLNWKGANGVTRVTEQDLMDMIQTRFGVSRGTPESYIDSLQNDKVLNAHPLNDERLLRRIDDIRLESTADYSAGMDASIMTEREQEKYPPDIVALLGEAYADTVEPYYYTDEEEYAEVCIDTVSSLVRWAGRFEKDHTGDSKAELGGASHSRACVAVASYVTDYVLSKHYEVDAETVTRVEAAATLARHSTEDSMHPEFEDQWTDALELLTVVVSSDVGGGKPIESAEMLGVDVGASDDEGLEAFRERVQAAHSEGEFNIDDMTELQAARDALLD